MNSTGSSRPCSRPAPSMTPWNTSKTTSKRYASRLILSSRTNGSTKKIYVSSLMAAVRIWTVRRKWLLDKLQRNLPSKSSKYQMKCKNPNLSKVVMFSFRSIRTIWQRKRSIRTKRRTDTISCQKNRKSCPISNWLTYWVCRLYKPTASRCLLRSC